MEAKERVQAILNRQSVDRIPVDMWWTPEVFQALADHTGQKDELSVSKALGLDKMPWTGLLYKGKLRETKEENHIASFWGVLLEKTQSGAAEYAEMVENPLLNYGTVEALDDYPWWPKVEEFDQEQMVAQIQQLSRDFAVYGPWVSFFEIYCQLRGLEQALMDLLMDPDYVNALLDRIEAIQTDVLKTLLPQVKDNLEGIFYSDDMGSQNALLISLDNWQQFFAPRVKRWCDLVHSYDLKVFHHTDGAVYELIPHLIEAGIDVLNPIQHVCPGMEMDRLKADFGDRLIFHGGVENQLILPRGTVEEVKEETRNCLKTLGKGGGYICCSCHNVQAGTPVENILAMIETVKEEGHQYL